MIRLPAPAICRALGFALMSFAAAPDAAQADPRVQLLAFHENAVIPVAARPGYEATIAFADGEQVENIAVGSSAHWQITPNRRADRVFVKPTSARAAPTNMTVITDRHIYLFALHVGLGREPLFLLRFSYPDDPPPQPPVMPAAALTPAEPAQPANPVLDPATLHFGWRQRGARALLPDRVFDDGHAVYLAWPKAAICPPCSPPRRAACPPARAPRPASRPKGRSTIPARAITWWSMAAMPCWCCDRAGRGLAGARRADGRDTDTAASPGCTRTGACRCCPRSASPQGFARSAARVRAMTETLSDPRAEMDADSLAQASRNAFPVVAGSAIGKDRGGLLAGVAMALALGGLTFFTLHGRSETAAVAPAPTATAPLPALSSPIAPAPTPASAAPPPLPPTAAQQAALDRMPASLAPDPGAAPVMVYDTPAPK
jgi:type IV secretory pathway VirB9-like protein